MHILGKIFAWLIVLLAVAASVLTAGMLQVRNSWSKKVADLRVEAETNETQVSEKELRLRQLDQELARVMLGWNEYWSDVQVDVLDQQAGSIRAAVGSDRGIKQGQMLYVFQPNAAGDGQVFVGPFVVESARQDQAGLRPAWRFRPGEPESWKYGSGWRLRVAVPTAALSSFRDLEIAFTSSDEALDAKQRYLAAQEELKRIAQEHLNFRIGELHSNEELRAKQGELPDHVVDGLVVALEKEEEARNAVLVQVDTLRRQLKIAVEEYERLRSENERLAQQLGSPSPATAGR